MGFVTEILYQSLVLFPPPPRSYPYGWGGTLRVPGPRPFRAKRGPLLLLPWLLPVLWLFSLLLVNSPQLPLIMHPAVRSQVDDLQELYSLESGLACTPEEDKARQEFKAEADINVLLRKYGAVPQRPLSYGEVDFDLDLHTAINAVSQASLGYASLPEHVRRKFPDLPSLFAAIANGEAVDFTAPPPSDGSSSEGGGAAGGAGAAPPSV